MRIQLRGVNRVTKRLADGRTVTYWYAWKGGPRLDGMPGSPEFIAAYNKSVEQKIRPPQGVLLSILHGYQQSQDFQKIAQRTRADYARIIKREIEPLFADFPLSAMVDRRTRGLFLEWRDRRAIRSRRQADYAWAVLARILSWALNRGMIAVNPCVRGGRTYRGSRVDKIWTLDDEALFLNRAPRHLHLPLMLALWTGQRQGDLLKLAWSNYDGTHIRLRQSKTSARVAIPVGAPLKVLLDGSEKHGPLILVSTDKRPWTPDGFRASWGKAMKKAGVTGVTFNDLRGTAATRLAVAGCTEAEIATITGHSLRDVRSILDAHYLHRDPALAESAIRKLERGTRLSN